MTSGCRGLTLNQQWTGLFSLPLLSVLRLCPVKVNRTIISRETKLGIGSFSLDFIGLQLVNKKTTTQRDKGRVFLSLKFTG